MAWHKLVYFYIVTSKLLWIQATHGSDGCRTLKFNPSFESNYFKDHVIESSRGIKTKDDCQLKCYMNNDCMSYNFGTAQGECELSDSSHEIHPGDLNPREGFTYTPTENFCVNNRCSKDHGRCQLGLTDRGYRCVCSAGFTGEYCTKEILGQDQAKPGDSCKHILESETAVGDGEYWIDLEKDGNPLRVYCDMTTDGGGWLLVANVTYSINYWAPHSAQNSYHTISTYHNNLMGITTSAMNQLRTHLPFTQLRFHCSKHQGRTFHVITAANSTGEAVVQYLSGQTDVLPASCGSFVKMEDENSFLAQKCSRWGNHGSHYVGKWGHYNKKGEWRMYDHAAFVANKYHWHIRSDNVYAWLCDDVGADNLLPSPGDFWKIYVR